MFVNLDTDDSAYETARQCPPLLLGCRHKPPRAGNGARAPTGRLDAQSAQADAPAPQRLPHGNHRPHFTRREPLDTQRPRRQGTQRHAT